MTVATIDQHVTDEDLERALRADVRTGLTTSPKELRPVWFYDARGSELFEEITRLPEYYPTRSERAILEAHADDIARRSRADTLVELGSGSSDKTRLLLDALQRAGTLRRYVPVDVSVSALREAVSAISADYPDLVVHGVAGDFERHLDRVPRGGRRLTAFLGGTIGNFAPAQRATFLRTLRADLVDGDAVLLGTDLVKGADRLVPAYDDAAGVTAAFNKNVLAVLNSRLGADFDLDAFAHVALWDPEAEWIEMRLRSLRDQQVELPALGLRVRFAAGEEMRTEISAKFRRETLAAELQDAGLALQGWWTDPAGDFALSLSTPR
ncbi:MAG: L-histidine N(alpha)-methyltransferase [Actinomycetota bacterium]|nr:L-histidine N(alpha)-methyltransferase [Actinomycetota bacterium]